MPETFFGWLNFIPRVGGRLSYYSHATGPGATDYSKGKWPSHFMQFGRVPR